MQNLLYQQIKNAVEAISPDYQLIIFGSEARGTANQDSDLDLLILSKSESVSVEEELLLREKLYEIELASGKVISTLVLAENEWESLHKHTPFFATVNQEGIWL